MARMVRPIRRIVVLLALAFAVLASGCVAYGDPGAYRHRSHYGYYGGGWPARTVVVERAYPVYSHRYVRARRVPRREWVREHRHHQHDHDRDRDRHRRHRRDGHRRR